MLTESLQFACPWCGEPNGVECEPGDAGQWIIQDCMVCCSPIELRLPYVSTDALIVQREGD
ncbi:MAG: CPXCG motif-containing cysteine-rich protein [Pseudomonadota bacterium]